MLRRLINRLTMPKQPAPVEELYTVLATLPQFSVARMASDTSATEGV